MIAILITFIVSLAGIIIISVVISNRDMKVFREEINLDESECNAMSLPDEI